MNTGRHGAMGMILIGLAAAGLPPRPPADTSELAQQSALTTAGIDVSNTVSLLEHTIGKPSDVRIRVSTNGFSPEVTSELRVLHERLGKQIEQLEKAQYVEGQR